MAHSLQHRDMYPVMAHPQVARSGSVLSFCGKGWQHEQRCVWTGITEAPLCLR